MIRDMMLAAAATPRRLIEVGDVTGGETTQVGNVRYHVFRTVGDASITVNADGPLEYAIVGGSEDGHEGSAASAGAGGRGGHVVSWTSMVVAKGDIIPVHVGGVGGESRLGSVAAAGAVGDGTTLSGLPPVLGLGDTLGGNGPSDSAPLAPVYGRGGSGGFHVQATYGQPSHSETHQNPSRQETVDRSYGARAEQYQSGSTVVHGATANCAPYGPGVQGPDGSGACVRWNVTHNEYVGQAHCPGGWRLDGGHCDTDTPTYATRYHCDSGGSLSGTTCVKHETITVGGGSSTVQVWDPCGAGFNAVGGQCVDAKGTTAGKGSQGVVLVRHQVAVP